MSIYLIECMDFLRVVCRSKKRADPKAGSAMAYKATAAAQSNGRGLGVLSVEGGRIGMAN